MKIEDLEPVMPDPDATPKAMESQPNGDAIAMPPPEPAHVEMTGEPGAPHYVVFDTEGNGLFKYKDENGVSISATDPCQPRLASIAVITADIMGRPISREKHFIKPDGWSMHDLDHESAEKGKPTASEVNGLTDEFLAANGIPIFDVLDMWNGFVDRGLIITAFNSQHDCKHMRAELRHANLPDRFEETPNTCLMRSLKPYKEQGLPVAGWGMISLEKACEFFGIVQTDAHDAMSDTEDALKILQILIRDGNLIPPKVHYAAKPPASF